MSVRKHLSGVYPEKKIILQINMKTISVHLISVHICTPLLWSSSEKNRFSISMQLHYLLIVYMGKKWAWVLKSLVHL